MSLQRFVRRLSPFLYMARTLLLVPEMGSRLPRTAVGLTRAASCWEYNVRRMSQGQFLHFAFLYNKKRGLQPTLKLSSPPRHFSMSSEDAPKSVVNMASVSAPTDRPA